MRYKLTFGAGLATGYLLGSKAGRSRYEEIMRKLRGLSEDPTVQETAGVVQARAAGLTQAAKRLVTDKVDTVAGKAGGQPSNAPADSAPDLTVTDLTTTPATKSSVGSRSPVPAAAPAGSAPTPGATSSR